MVKGQSSPFPIDLNGCPYNNLTSERLITLSDNSMMSFIVMILFGVLKCSLKLSAKAMSVIDERKTHVDCYRWCVFRTIMQMMHDMKSFFPPDEHD